MRKSKLERSSNTRIPPSPNLAFMMSNSWSTAPSKRGSRILPVVVPPVAKLRNKLGGVDTAHESSSWLVLCRSSPKTSHVREHCVCISIDTENFETTKTHTHDAIVMPLT